MYLSYRCSICLENIDPINETGLLMCHGGCRFAVHKACSETWSEGQGLDKREDMSCIICKKTFSLRGTGVNFVFPVDDAGERPFPSHRCPISLMGKRLELIREAEDLVMRQYKSGKTNAEIACKTMGDCTVLKKHFNQFGFSSIRVDDAQCGTITLDVDLLHSADEQHIIDLTMEDD